jgi:acetyl esterase/lipase
MMSLSKPGRASLEPKEAFMLSPQFQKLLENLGRSSANSEASRDEIIAAYRQEIEDCLVIDGVAPSIAKTTNVKRVSAGGIPSEWVLAESADPDYRIMHIHGGGFMAGTLGCYRHVVEALSRASDMAVLAIDYRLAPENPFPAGLDDCVSAWTWMLRHGPVGENEPSAAFLAGDSAGGHLALALMLRLRDEGKPLPKAAAAFSPGADFTGSGPSMTERAAIDPTFSREKLDWVADVYVSDGTPLTHPYVSPYFGDYSGLPPFLIQTGEREVLHDDGKRVVEKARKVGVAARFKTLPGLVHGTENWCHLVPEGLATLNEAGNYLKSHL